MSHVHPPHRRVPPGIFVPVLAVLLAICLTGTTASAGVSSKRRLVAASLAGTWSGQYSGTISGTFTLHWRLSGASLDGSIKLSNPVGSYVINGIVHGTALSFGVVGAGATYTGSVSGSSMAGTWKSTATGGGKWSARKTS
jgi:hypothetical protein